MSLKSGKKFSLDEMTAMHEIAPIDETPTVIRVRQYHSFYIPLVKHGVPA